VDKILSPVHLKGQASIPAMLIAAFAMVVLPT